MEPVLVSLEAGVLRVTLNRPEKLNAFNPAVHQGLADAMTRAETEGAIRCLLVTGAGRGFCAGQDLTERDMKAASIDLGGGLETWYNPLVKRMRALPKPIVCAVNGVAAGAGANFALACDIVLAARSASFIQAFVKIGLVPDCGGSYFLPRLAGSAASDGAGDDSATGSPPRMPSAGASIWKALDDDKLMAEATKLATNLAAGPTQSLGMIKKAMYASAGNTLAAQLDLERDLQREVGRGKDYREGVAAFLEKRKPSFTGQ